MDRDRVAVAGEVLGDGLVVVDLFAHLVEIDDFHLRAELQVAGGRGQLAEEHLDQGGLAGAVGADEADLVAAVEDEAEVADEGGAAGVGEGDVLGFDDADAGAFGFADLHLGRARRGAHGAALGAHLDERLHAGVRLRAAGARAASGPGFFLAELLVEGGALAFFGHEELLLADEVGVVVAGPAGELATVQLDDAVGHATQEGAVVRDEEQRDLLFEEEFLHPKDRVQVHVVGRLVEQEQAGLGGQGLGEEAATLEAAGEGVELAVFGEAEAGDQVVDAKVFLPVFRVVVGPDAGGHDVADVAGQAFGDLLGQAGDADAFGDGDRAGIGGGLTGGDAHEGGLAGAVATEQTYAFAFLDLEVEVIQDGRAAEADIDVEETE